jgi:hypothetical protein
MSPPGELARLVVPLWITPELGVSIRSGSTSADEAAPVLPSDSCKVRPTPPPAASPCASSLSPSASSVSSVRMILSRGLPSGGPAAVGFCGAASSHPGLCGVFVGADAAGASASSTATYAPPGGTLRVGWLAALAVVAICNAYLLRPSPFLAVCASLDVLEVHATTASQPSCPDNNQRGS